MTIKFNPMYMKPMYAKHAEALASPARRSLLSARILALFSFIFLAATLAFSPAVRADEGGDIVWTASKVRGTVTFRESNQGATQWMPLRDGSLLSTLAELKTGPDGHAELSYDTSTIVAAPNSELRLPGPTPRNAVYRVSQNVGTFLYKIKHATRDKFEVQTPYLTTIIKGTVFTVLSGATGGAVHVTEGAVFVRPSSGQGGAFVRPGETARINNASRDRVIIQGAKASPSQNAPAGRNDDAGKDKAQGDTRGNTRDSAASNQRGNGSSARLVKIVFRDAAPVASNRGLSGKIDRVRNSSRRDASNDRDRDNASKGGLNDSSSKTGTANFAPVSGPAAGNNGGNNGGNSGGNSGGKKT